jgi:hypothetical protein
MISCKTTSSTVTITYKDTIHVLMSVIYMQIQMREVTGFKTRNPILKHLSARKQEKC